MIITSMQKFETDKAVIKFIKIIQEPGICCLGGGCLCCGSCAVDDHRDCCSVLCAFEKSREGPLFVWLNHRADHPFYFSDISSMHEAVCVSPEQHDEISDVKFKKMSVTEDLEAAEGF